MTPSADVRSFTSFPPHLLILCPLFHGGGSGAATYYRLLADALLQKGMRITVVSDGETGDFAGDYLPLFPSRCGRDKRFWRDRLAYGIQNLRYRHLPDIVRRVSPDIILVHTSFYNQPGLFPRAMGKVREAAPRARLIADVRDQLLPAGKVRLLSLFDGVIACSENVKQHLMGNGLESTLVHHIPIPQELLHVEPASVNTTLERLGVRHPFILYAGLIKESKGVPLLLDSFRHLRKTGNGLNLVLAGHLKTDNRSVVDGLKEEGVTYLGNLPRPDILALMQGAAICVNLSQSEGMPRASLEPLGMGRPVLLPRGIPEFDRHCPGFVVQNDKPADVARQIADIARQGSAPCYPTEDHDPRQIITRYCGIFAGEHLRDEKTHN